MQRVEARRRALSEACQSIFKDRDNAVLEIGCGHGHFLAAYAEAHPASFCVGIDLISRRVDKSNQKRDKRSLGNLVFLKADAGEFLDVLPSSVRFSQIFIIFPDPWPKKRHHKNRLVQSAFLETLAGFTIPGGRLFFRTDHEPYYNWTLEHLNEHALWLVDEKSEWPFEVETYFQQMMGDYQSLVAVRAG